MEASEKHVELRGRTKKFALRVVRLTDALPQTRAARVFGDQLLRCSSSVAANYRAAGRSRSREEFIAKMCVCLEEADESIFWLEMIQESEMIKQEKLAELLKEANELAAFSSRLGAPPGSLARP